MSELKAALEAILRVNFRAPVPVGDQARMSDFLERAATELLTREELVTERERNVSQREANVTVREDESAVQVKTLASMQRLAKAIDLQPVTTRAPRFGRWLARR